MWKKFKELFLHPPLWVALLVSIIALGLIASALVLISLDIIGIPLYVVSGFLIFFLSCDIYLIIEVIVPWIKSRSAKHRYVDMFFNDAPARLMMITGVFFFINFGFAIFQLVIGLVLKNTWYLIMSAFYFALCLTRGLLIVFEFIGYKKKESLKEKDIRHAKAYGLAGLMLIIIDACMVGAISYMMVNGKPLATSSAIVIANAAYTFYKFIFALVQFIKVRKTLLNLALNSISLADGAMSLFSLSITMIDFWGTDEDNANMTPFTSIFGFAIALLTVLWGGYMFISSFKKVKLAKLEIVPLEQEAQNGNQQE